jgi:glyoxylase-like metal-dependent hydrolase (beta-lactamase superfamily II)/pimeloyl-ACP methyl ester carboxylesterase
MRARFLAGLAGLMIALPGAASAEGHVAGLRGITCTTAAWPGSRQSSPRRAGTAVSSRSRCRSGGTYQLIVPDACAQGRTTDRPEPLTYHAMAEDVVALMDRLHVPKARVMGWSDGGIVGLDLAIHHPDRITHLVCFGANFRPDGLAAADVAWNDTATAAAFGPDMKRGYQAISPNRPRRGDGDHRALEDAAQPRPRAGTIRAKALIVAGEFDLVRREHTGRSHAIPDARLWIAGANRGDIDAAAQVNPWSATSRPLTTELTLSAPDAAAAWIDLGHGIHVRQSRAYWMNSVVLLDPEHTVLVDPGVLPSEIEEIARLVQSAEPEAVTLLFTHGHWDHVLGRPWWPDASVVAHDACAAEVEDRLEHIRHEAETLATEHGEAWARRFEPFRVDRPVSGQCFLKLDPWRFVLRDAYGHSDSQLSVHLPELRLLLAADMLSDIEIPILNQPPAVYRRTLDSLLTLAEGGAFEVLVPGHGGIAFGGDAVLARLRTDLEYLAALERGVAEARNAGLSLAAAQERLDAMEFVGKRSDGYSMVETHRRNVERTWRHHGS